LPLSKASAFSMLGIYLISERLTLVSSSSNHFCFVSVNAFAFNISSPSKRSPNPFIQSINSLVRWPLTLPWPWHSYRKMLRWLFFSSNCETNFPMVPILGIRLIMNGHYLLHLGTFIVFILTGVGDCG